MAAVTAIIMVAVMVITTIMYRLYPLGLPSPPGLPILPGQLRRQKSKRVGLQMLQCLLQSIISKIRHRLRERLFLNRLPLDLPASLLLLVQHPMVRNRMFRSLSRMVRKRMFRPPFRMVRKQMFRSLFLMVSKQMSRFLFRMVSKLVPPWLLLEVCNPLCLCLSHCKPVLPLLANILPMHLFPFPNIRTGTRTLNTNAHLSRQPAMYHRMTTFSKMNRTTRLQKNGRKNQISKKSKLSGIKSVVTRMSRLFPLSLG
mmetsp:Transcript_534/g.976  ORF Transcript_534/g.976 Transcript_534/m.976 type:complete len:256 (+) Transcript_534:345-1112(+)